MQINLISDTVTKPSDEMIKLDYKNRMDKFRPDKIIILKRRMRIYWYHKENS